VLHAFQKKATQGIKTPKGDVALIKARFERAKAHRKAATKSPTKTKKGERQ
jgi:phage-related protein